MGDEAILAADSFLMKGEEVPAQAQWGGNPARMLKDYQISSVAQSALAQPDARPALPQAQEEQPDTHLALPQAQEEQLASSDEGTELIPEPEAAPQSSSQAGEEQLDYWDERTELIPVVSQPLPQAQEEQHDYWDERTELIPVPQVISQSPSQAGEEQQDHRDEDVDQLEESTEKIPVVCGSGLLQAAPRRTLCGGKTR
jgi:hypothetical protein